MKIKTTCLVLFLSAVCFAGGIKEDFENWSLKGGWEIVGDAKISGDQKHGGKNSLYLPLDSKAEWKINEYENNYGKFILWFYDSKVGNVSEGTWNRIKKGPAFGVKNLDGDKLMLGFVCIPGWTWGNYFWYSSLSTEWYKWAPVNEDFNGDNVAKGWHKFTFEFKENRDIRVTLDDIEAKLPQSKSKFRSGFCRIFFEGGNDGEETAYFDDLEVIFDNK